MSWDVEYTNEFGIWQSSLSEDEQVSLAASVQLLEERGPMRELYVQHDGRLLRTLYAFDPGRSAILPIGGDKTGDNRWYDTPIPIADQLYDEHLLQLKKEGLI